MRRSARYTLLDQAAKGDWKRFIKDEFPRSDETWIFEYHNFIQLISVKKAPCEVFEKYLPRMKGLVNSVLYENGNTPLHLLMGKDYFCFQGNPHYEVDPEDLLKTVKYLIDNGADPNQKNGDGQRPLDIAIKNNTFPSVIAFLKTKTEDLPKEEVPKSFWLFSCCLDPYYF